MKKIYNRPTTCVVYSSVKSFILDVSPWRTQSNMVDYTPTDLPNQSDMKVNNGMSSGSISGDANQRGGFGTDAGPWESLW